MQVTLDSVLSSKTYMKNSSINFNSPRQYLEPAIERLSKLGGDIQVEVSGIVENANDDRSVNESYSRVLVKSVLPNYGLSGYSGGTVGFLYGLDTQKPVVKVYTGQEVFACTNLCVFGASNVYTGDILVEGMDVSYEMLTQYIREKEQELANFIKVKTTLENNILDIRGIDQFIGRLLRESIPNKYLGTQPIISATKDLYDPKSIYSIREGETSKWNIYQAITQYITDKVDIVDKATKTIILEKIFMN